MTQCSTLNVKWSNSQLNKLKSGTTKNVNEVTLNFSWNVIGNSNKEHKNTHKLLFANTKVSTLPKVFANNSSANIKLSKTQLNKIAR